MVHAGVRRGLALALLLLSVSLAGCTDGGEPTDGSDLPQSRFLDIAREPDVGIDYVRLEGPHYDDFAKLAAEDPIPQRREIVLPPKPHGAPGVALLDFDGDEDLDVFVPRGPGSSHSLFANRLSETGELVFEDVARQAGVAASGQDGSGVCFGDTDNDGDEDLLVLSVNARHRFFENRGDGTFRDASDRAGMKKGRGAVACSMGDLDGDGRLDVAIANTYQEWGSFRAITKVPFDLNRRNDLYRNAGGNRFEAVGNRSGFHDLAGIHEGASTITWAIAMVDYDRDGDVDILHADDQGGMNHADADGVDRGYVHVFENDGTGNLTDVTLEVGTDIPGSYMGLTFGDYDRDGQMDFFQTNLGDFFQGPEYDLGLMASDWFLGTPDGTFHRPGVGALNATPFGWGAATVDFDNDADQDIVYHGGMGMGLRFVLDNPGAVLENDGSAHFEYPPDVLDPRADHTRRAVEGVASGDLDRDGRVDLVSVAGFRVPGDQPVQHLPLASRWRGPFAETAFFGLLWEQRGPNRWYRNTWEHQPGDLVVEMNRGGTVGGWVEVETRGSVGLTPNGSVNRDGIGAVVEFTPEGGQPSLLPVVGGSSYASQHSLAAHFGLGEAKQGTVEVLWPGGTRNVLRNVSSGERIVFPEIPCSVDGAFASRDAYRDCVDRALSDLVDEGVLDASASDRFRRSALEAYG